MPRYTEAEATDAIAKSQTMTGALRELGLCTTGGNNLTLRKYIERWGISTAHFDADAARAFPRRQARPLSEVLVVDSTYPRRSLKQRLYAEGLKTPRCELCGQGETWRDRPLALVLDHVNGVRDDNRLENLRILCPNCNATLDTHCGRKNRRLAIERDCALCGAGFRPRDGRQRYCSRTCGQRAPRPGPRLSIRRAERPAYADLVAEIEATSYEAVGRRFGVSGSAVRKWRRAYELDPGEQSASAMLDKKGRNT